MSAEEALFRAQSTTALYDRASPSTPSHLATLSEAKPEYKLLPALPDDANDREQLADGVHDAPVIVVQVRKRKGEVQLLLDGHVSTGEVDKKNNITRHNLSWHRGLHEDLETNTRVFSPLAIVAAVEDGQHAFQDITVALVQQYAENGRQILSPTVLSENRLLEHRVSDVRCRVVHAPYPLSYPVPPTVIIEDNQSLRTKKAKESLKFVAEAVNESDILNKVLTVAGTIDESNLEAAQAALLGTVLFGGAAVGAQWIDLYYGGAWSAVAYFFLELLKMVDKKSDNSIWSVSDAKRGKLAFRMVKDAARRWFTLLPDPQKRRTKFTVAELASVLETIANRRRARAAASDQLRAALDDLERVGTEEYRKEQVVWMWLLDKTDALDFDITGLEPSNARTSTLRVRISVDDSLACTSGQHYHEIECNREDSHRLGAVAAGTLEDMHRLYAAVVDLMNANQDEIDGKKPVFDPLQATLKAAGSVAPGPPGNATTAKKDDAAAAAEQAAADAEQANLIQWMQYDAKTRPTLGKGAFVVLKRRLRAWLAGSKSPLGEMQKKDLVTINEQLRRKLIKRLFLPKSPGASMIGRLELALKRKHTWLVRTSDKEWTRRLPQRARSTVVTVFATVPEDATGRVDIDAGKAFTRVYSEYHDAARWLSSSMVGAKMALRRFLREWEASSSTRIKLTCVCVQLQGAALNGRVDETAHGTLALTAPADIQFSGVVAAATEHAQRRIRLVVRRAQQQGARSQYDASVLEALGLEHSDASLLACQIFGDLWIDELVALWNLGNSKQAEMLEQASLRATHRLRAAGEFLRELIVERNAASSVSDADDVALGSTDIAFVATQSGRDAALFMDRLFFHQNFIALRAAMVPLIREAARAAMLAATAFRRAVPTRLPYEPAASLFGSPYDGIAAFVRTQRASGGVRAVVEAATGAYPSTLLLNAAEHHTQDVRDEVASRPSPSVRSHNTAMKDLVKAMQSRMASLRMDPGVADLQGSPTAVTVDALAKTLSTMHILPDGKGVAASFYVPYGFGDARPAPTLPPCAAPMFGSVPVFGGSLANAFRMVQTDNWVAGDGAALHVQLLPVYGCLATPINAHDHNEAESVHPNVVQVMSVGERVVQVHYAASGLPDPVHVDPGSAPADTASADGFARDYAVAHVRSGTTTQLASEVASIAWNAERIVQAVTAALASGNDADDDDPTTPPMVVLSLRHPPDDLGSQAWYKKPDHPMMLAQKRRKRMRKVEVSAKLLELFMEHHRDEVEKLLKILKKRLQLSPFSFTNNTSLEAEQKYALFTQKLETLDRTGPKKTDAEQLAAYEARLELSDSWATHTEGVQNALAVLLLDSAAALTAVLNGNGAPLPNVLLYKVAEEQSNATTAPGPSNAMENLLTVDELWARYVVVLRELDKLVAVIKDAERDLKDMLDVPRVYDGVFSNEKALLNVKAQRDAAAEAARDARKRHKKRQQRALEGALGIGMGMLSPQLLGNRVQLGCVDIVPPADGLQELPLRDVAADLEDACSRCDALRLSEACLLVSSFA